MGKKIQTPDNQEFNKKIEFLIKRKGLTARAIAEQLEIKENRISQIKAGSNAVSEAELFLLNKTYETMLADYEPILVQSRTEYLENENARLRAENLKGAELFNQLSTRLIELERILRDYKNK